MKKHYIPTRTVAECRDLANRQRAGEDLGFSDDFVKTWATVHPYAGMGPMPDDIQITVAVAPEPSLRVDDLTLGAIIPKPPETPPAPSQAKPPATPRKSPASPGETPPAAPTPTLRDLATKAVGGLSHTELDVLILRGGAPGKAAQAERDRRDKALGK